MAINRVKSLWQLMAIFILCSLNTGCATRALMSSDRYEKPVESRYQDQSSLRDNSHTLAEDYAAFRSRRNTI